MLNSTEYEFLNARKYENVYFHAHNVKMPTFVGILIFMSRKNEHEKGFITSGPGAVVICHAQDRKRGRAFEIHDINFIISLNAYKWLYWCSISNW